MPGCRGNGVPDSRQHGVMTDAPRGQASAPPIRWWPDDSSVRILAAYARRKEKRGDVLRRALRMLAIADGVVDPRGRVRVEPRVRRP